MHLLRIVFCLLAFSWRVASGDLQSDVRDIIATSDLNQGHAGVFIYDTASRKVLVDINATDGMIPASNQKLLTAGAALHILGSTFQFQTKLLRDGDDLIVVGDGDPSLGDSTLLCIQDWSQENMLLDAALQPWVDAVKKAGIESIETLVIDDRIFDTNFVHPSWPADQINNWYCAQVAGINYHLNVVHFYPSPSKGTRANLGNITPRMPWLTFGNRTTSRTGKKEKSSFWVARTPNSNEMTARGNVKSIHKKPVKIAFHDPPLVFGQTLASLLQKKGIPVEQVTRISETAPPSTGELVFVKRTLLQVVLQRSNTDSHNLYAESLLKRLAAGSTGKVGTFDEGAAFVDAVVTQRLGSYQHGLTSSDGSGMSRDNSVSPKTLALWLASFDIQEPAGKALVDSLATPGKGTLDNRFVDGVQLGASVHAKSGYLRGVSALSGYIVFEDRPPLVFSILVNDVKGTVKGAKRMQETIVNATIGDQSH